jgi:Ion channel
MVKRKCMHSLLASNDEDAGDVDTDDKKSWHPEKLVASFLRNLLLGLTLPFPQLRSLLLRKKKSEGIKIGLGVRECLAFISLYMTVGVLAFSFVFERWSIIDSLYFTCVCFTTVG